MGAKIIKLRKEHAKNHMAVVNQPQPKNFKHYVVAAPFLIIESFASLPAHAQEDIMAAGDMAYTFNKSLIHGFGAQSAIDLEAFLKDSVPPEGVYNVDFLINDQYKKTLDISFSHNKENNNLTANIPVTLLQESGVKEEALREVKNQPHVIISEAINGAVEQFNFNKLVLNLFIPGTAMLNNDFNDAPPSQWDYGETVLFSNYAANYYQTQNKSNQSKSSSFYLSSSNGLNVGRWRLRNQMYYTKSDNSAGKLTSVATYVQRALPKLRSELTIGQAFTSSRLFDGTSFRGLKLESDNRMLPRRQQGYAPEIHGVAETNARVKVRQGDNIIYEVTVAPGPFVINDLIPNTYGRDLDVEVLESNGTVNHFTVSYSAVNQSLRPGLSMYSMTLGETDKHNTSRVKFAELTYERGLSNILTVNSGLQVAENHYNAATFGAVVSTKLGALGLNATYSSFDNKKAPKNDKEKGKGKEKGWMIKGTYSRLFDATNTNITFAAYRYATKGFTTLNDSLQKQDKDAFNYPRSSAYQQRQRIEVNVNQNLGSWGALYANTTIQQYHNSPRKDTQYQIGYANNFKQANYTISALHQTSNNNSKNDVVTLGVSIPLSAFSNRATLSTHYNRNRNGNGYLQTRLSGTLGKEKDVNYNLSFNRDLKQKTSGAGINLSKSTSFGTFSTSYMHQTNSNQISASAQGAAVVHKGGVTVGPFVGDTFAIVEAKDAKGASLNGVQGVSINRSGYALVPAMSAYTYNQVTLNPEKMSSHVELQQTQKRIAPTAGAAVKVKFETSKGYPILVTSKHNNANALPLGATVFSSKNENIGIVGQGSRAYARVKDEAGTLLIRWGKEENQQCTIQYQLPKNKIKDDMILLNAPCI